MALTNRDILHKYLRHSKKFPHIWCPGCGNGIVLSAFLRAVDTTGWTHDEIVMASGIGCAARSPVYVDFNTLHTAHGRALTFATGIKAAKPKMKVVVMTGDGDAVGIGGNHFIHACRRNIDITAIIINNMVYGMTGGQQSPTTPKGAKASTARGGVAEQPFDIAELAVASGATFVARSTTYHAKKTENLIKKALNHKGFSVVEVISQAPVCYGRRNGIATAAEMMQWQRDKVVSVSEAKDMTFEERRSYIVTGVLMEREMTEWTEGYAEVRRDAGWEGDE
jgi:2-oxoglutarate ferredoxin oxidoreductase subunit beta